MTLYDAYLITQDLIDISIKEEVELQELILSYDEQFGC